MSTRLAAMTLLMAMNRIPVCAPSEVRAEPEPEIEPSPAAPVSRQQRRYLERQAAKAARRKASQ